MDKSIPTSKLSRTSVVTKAVLKIGAQQTKGFVKRKLSSKKDEQSHQDNTDAKTAQIIIEALGHLKGISVKIAQQIALGMPFLPKEYLDQISKSFNAIPPINKALIRKIIKQELGANPNEVFCEFESEAFGAASLGQVHKAKYDGDEVAVKVQYPGIAKSIDSDLSILQFVLKRVAKGHDISHLIKELKDRLFEEVDYEKEAKNCSFFKDNLDFKDIVIPKIYEEVSTKKILVSSFLAGKSFEEFIRSEPSQEEVNHYAQLIFDSFFYSVYHLQTIHADPNPGNFIFMDDGKLGLIDFGCVKQIEDDFLKDVNRLYCDLLDKKDDEEVLDHYIGLGMIVDGTHSEMLQFYQETIKPFDSLYMEVLRGGSFDFGENSDFSKKGFEKILEVQKKQYEAIHKINQEFIFVDRSLLGYYGMFEKMGARIDTTKAVKLIRGFYEDNRDNTDR
jgi:predicted unusual protein kinase regulating ubiquinone biosynthesis (AarF/ABC1/UbiB family)